MGRMDHLRRFANKDALGIEVAPYFNPTVSKADGYNVLAVDVFDTEQLRKNAEADPAIDPNRIQEIEEVDIVSDASVLGDVITQKGLAGTVDYIISSHNFEHLPNPILFLQGCSVALKPGGTLTMAVPDFRLTFDYYRLPTRLADWLAAYHGERGQPSAETLFDAQANTAPYVLPDGTVGAYVPGHGKVEHITPNRDLKGAYERYIKEKNSPGEYRDAHCSVFFGPLLELMLRDLKHLGLIDLEVIDISDTIGIEFFVNMRKPETDTVENEEEFYARRLELLRAVRQAMGASEREMGSSAIRRKRMLRNILGDGLVDKFREMNTKRRKARRAR